MACRMRPMKVISIALNEKEAYEAFLKAHGADFHQSWAWGEFQEKIASRGRFWALAVVEGDQWLGALLVVRHRLPFGLSWFSVARGPVLRDSKSGSSAPIWEILWDTLHALARKEGAVFVRLEAPESFPIALEKPWRKAHAHYQPEWTLKLDLSLSEEELLQQMKPKGRYNIKVAAKRVAVRFSHRSEDVSAFYAILKQTSERDGFAPHSEAYYQEWVLCAQAQNWGGLFVAEVEGKIVAGILITFYGDTATYYYGASDYHYREAMAPYLLQWTAIQEAKRRGLKWYDFLGISPPGDGDHSWKGVTAFKEKFGGMKVHYPPAQEYVFRLCWYWLIRFRKWWRRTRD